MVSICEKPAPSEEVKPELDALPPDAETLLDRAVWISSRLSCPSPFVSNWETIVLATDDSGGGLLWASIRVDRTEAENRLEGGDETNDVAVALDVEGLGPVEVAEPPSKSCRLPVADPGPAPSRDCIC